MTEAQRVAATEELTRITVHLSRTALGEEMPGACESQVLLRWIELVYGKELAARVAPFAELLGGAQ